MIHSSLCLKRYSASLDTRLLDARVKYEYDKVEFSSLLSLDSNIRTLSPSDNDIPTLSPSGLTRGSRNEDFNHIKRKGKRK